LSKTAAGLRAAFIEHDARRIVAAQFVRPHVVDVGADDVDKASGLVGRRAGFALLRRTAALDLCNDLLRDVGIDAEDEVPDQRQRECAKTPTRNANPTQPTPIFNTAAAATT
jgi:hypothetical protein